MYILLMVFFMVLISATSDNEASHISDQHQVETGPSITMSAVVSAPEMAVKIHFI